jgi:hypothetical protein
MININDKLIREDLAKIGVDALAVLLCITTHFNKFRVAWPGVERLRAMTALSKERTYNAIRKLQESGYIERWQENKDGKFGKTKYRLTTDYIGIYMGVSAFEMEELPLAGIPEHGIPEHGKPYYGNTEHLSINEKEGINEIKLINEREGSAPAPKNETFDIFAPDAHEKTAAYLIAYLEENAHLIPSEMRGKDWKRAVKGHCLKLKKAEQEVNLRIPKSEGEHYKWIGRRIAGMQSWHQVAAKFDKQDAAANGAAQYTTPSAVLPASVPRPQQRTAPDSAALNALKESQNRLGL